MKNSYFSIQKTFYWKKGIGPTFESIAEMVFVFIKLGNLSWEQSTDELFETWLRAIERSQLEQRTLWQSSRAEFLYRGLFIILWDIGKLRHTLSTPLRLLKTALSKWRAFGTRGCAYHELRVAHLVADDQTIRHLAAWLKRHPGAAADDLCCQRHPVSKLLWSLFLSPDTGQTGSWNFSATSDVGGLLFQLTAAATHRRLWAGSWENTHRSGPGGGGELLRLSDIDVRFVSRENSPSVVVRPVHRSYMSQRRVTVTELAKDCAMVGA